MSISEIKNRVLVEVNGIDRYLRREDTFLAESLDKTCSLRGPEYINSGQKRAFDMLIGIPSSVIATPLIITLATVKSIEDGKSPFFVHMRTLNIKENSINNNLPVWKIRCMKPNSDLGARGNSEICHGLAPENDPRNTSLGSFLRKYQLEELPQLYQVVLGKLSLFGIRPVVAGEDQEFDEQWTKERYFKWVQAYNLGKKGISGLAQTFGSILKGDSDNYHLDRFYYDHASLGMDMYLVWRTALRLTRIK